MLLRLLGSIFILTITGCIAVPVNLFYEEPFQQAELKRIAAGLDYEAVRGILGEPHAVREGGRFWFYGKTRPLIWLIGDGNDMTVEDYNWLELAFDESGKLVSLDFQEGKTGCSRSGNCLLWGAWDNRTMTDRAIFAAPELQDVSAKRFLPTIDGCALYIYFNSAEASLDRFFLSDALEKILVTNTPAFYLNKDTYLRIDLLPGEVVIKAGEVMVTGGKYGPIKNHTEMICESETLSFLHVQRPELLNRKVSYDWENDVTAKNTLSEKRLLLAP